MMNLQTTKKSKNNKLENYVISSWEDENLNLDTSLLRGIYAFGFEKPSPIQCKALMPMTSESKRDIIAQAQSGTGKTGAFAIGVLQKLCNSNYKNIEKAMSSMAF